MFVLYAAFSFVAWLFVGLPVATFFPARCFIRLPWPLTVIVGAALGPFALFMIFILLAHGRIDFSTFKGTGALVVYVALLRRYQTIEKSI
jgi:hypothetical protein